MIKRKNKYNASRTVIDGITFDSKLESNCYKIIKEHGMLGDTDLQKEFILQPKFRSLAGKVIQPIRYVCDFFVSKQYVIDAKGLELSEFKMKRKMLLFQKQMEIITVGSMIDMETVCIMMKNGAFPHDINQEIKQQKKLRKRKK